jgi:hypothetical protein
MDVARREGCDRGERVEIQGLVEKAGDMGRDLLHAAAVIAGGTGLFMIVSTAPAVPCNVLITLANFTSRGRKKRVGQGASGR